MTLTLWFYPTKSFRNTSFPCRNIRNLTDILDLHVRGEFWFFLRAANLKNCEDLIISGLAQNARTYVTMVSMSRLVGFLTRQKGKKIDIS